MTDVLKIEYSNDDNKLYFTHDKDVLIISYGDEYSLVNIKLKINKYTLKKLEKNIEKIKEYKRDREE